MMQPGNRRVTGRRDISKATRSKRGNAAGDSRRLAARCGVSNRTVFIHFPSLRDLYREALNDAAVRAAIERRVPQDRAGILRAVRASQHAYPKWASSGILQIITRPIQ